MAHFKDVQSRAQTYGHRFVVLMTKVVYTIKVWLQACEVTKGKKTCGNKQQ